MHKHIIFLYTLICILVGIILFELSNTILSVQTKQLSCQQANTKKVDTLCVSIVEQNTLLHTYHFLFLSSSQEYSYGKVLLRAMPYELEIDTLKWKKNGLSLKTKMGYELFISKKYYPKKR